MRDPMERWGEDMQVRIGFQMLNWWDTLVWVMPRFWEWQKRHWRWWLVFAALLILFKATHEDILVGILATIFEAGLFAIGASAVIRKGRSDARRERHAAALARIQEIEADALMDWDEWIELEMAYREGRLQRPKPKSKRSGYGVTMDEAVQALSLMAGYGHQPTRTVDTSNPPKSGSVVSSSPVKREPYDMSGDYRALHWFDYERSTLKCCSRTHTSDTGRGTSVGIPSFILPQSHRGAYRCDME